MTTTTSTTDGGPTPAEIALPSLDEVLALDPISLIGRGRAGMAHFDQRLFELTDEQLDGPFLASAGVGKWSCRALVTHLFDTEMMFTMRIRRVLAEDAPVFQVFDEHAFLDSPLSGMTGRGPGADPVRTPVGAMAASIHTLRQTMAATLYQLPEADWLRTGMHPERGPQRVRDLLSYDVWHLEHHAAYLNAKIVRMLGPAPAPGEREACADGAKPGGCGAGCGCVGNE